MEQSGQPQAAPLDQQQANLLLAVANLARRAKVGANNFYWIAALSVINSVISASNGSVSFVVGLGATQIVDALANAFAVEAPDGALIFKGIGIVLSVLISAVFALFGFFAGKMHRWAFITGMIFYALDALLLLLFQDWIGFLFHLYFLWGLWNGLQALAQLQKLAPPAQTVSDFPQNIGAP
ncbi:MAG: hypothetical protein HZB19_02930 [Chloroflexi bacterium]|nr:hypothetical protein [Chloroflexota bacterium]